MYLQLVLVGSWLSVVIMASPVVVIDQDARIIDLTHTISVESPSPPWFPPFNFTNVLTLNISDGVVAEANYFSSPEHAGTHIDAPKHFCPSAKSVHEIPVEQLSGPGAIINLRAKAEADPDFEVTEQTLQEWEGIHGRIPDGGMVLFDFGWHKRWPDIHKIYNSETLEFGTMHFPGLNPAGARWLTDNRKVSGVGTDTPSIDYGATTLYESHVILCRNDIIILENVANLEKLPPIGSYVFVGALKLENGTGTPSRIFAMLTSESSAISIFNLANVMFLTVCTVSVVCMMRQFMYT